MPRTRGIQDRQITPQQQQLVDAYLGEANGDITRAATIAGYSCPQFSGSRALKTKAVQEELRRRAQARGVPKDELIDRLARVARADITEFSDLVGQTDPEKIRELLARYRASGQGYLIKKLTPSRQGVMVELKDSDAALTTLARIMGMLVERVAIGPDLDFDALSNEQLEAIRDGRPA